MVVHSSRHRIAGPLIALLGMLALAAAPAQAETPPDTLVMAKDIADIITFDPAEAFEITTGELIANVYDRIMTFEPENPRTLTGGVAESHAVSDDGRTITFRLRDGLTFHSGNPVRPEDVEFSLERAVFLDRSPAFIVTQFGWNADNVGELIEVVDDRHVRITIAEGFSPGLVLNALSAGVASVVDRKLVLAHERDGDLGTAWLQTNSAGSDESVALEANPDYRHGVPGVQRVVLRHAVDYHGMVESFLAGQFIVHQAFWPRGLWAAYTGAPYRLDLPRARLILAPWSPDYVDPHANADAFARNPDNRPEAKLTGVLAWRNAWARDDLNAAVIRARDELDLERRAQLYLNLQRRLQTEGPYVIMFRQTDQIARRGNVTGFVSGPNFDHVWYRTVTKGSAAATGR